MTNETNPLQAIQEELSKAPESCQVIVNTLVQIATWTENAPKKELQNLYALLEKLTDDPHIGGALYDLGLRLMESVSDSVHMRTDLDDQPSDIPEP